MTVETCVKQYKLALEKGDKDKAGFWKERALRKAKHPKNAGKEFLCLKELEEPKQEPKKDGKKPKR